MILNKILAGAAIFAVTAIGVLASIGCYFAIQNRASINATITGVNQTVNDIDATVLIFRGAALNASMTLGRIEEASASIETASKSQEAYWRRMQAKSLETLESVHALSASLNDIVRNTDRSLNAEFLPAATATLAESELSIRETRIAAVEAVGGIKVPLADIHAILADPAIQQAVGAGLKSIQNTESMTGHLAKSAEHLEGYLAPKKLGFWSKLLQFLIPNLTIKLN